MREEAEGRSKRAVRGIDWIGLAKCMSASFDIQSRKEIKEVTLSRVHYLV